MKIIINPILITLLYSLISYFNIAILQSQYYELRRYFYHKKDRIKDLYPFFIIFFIIIISTTILPLFFDYTYYLTYLVPIILFFLTTKSKLKFTRRSFILLLINNLINIAVLLSVTLLYSDYLYLLNSLSPFIYTITLIITDFIDLLIEKPIQNHYYKLTKNKLSSCQNLKIIGITGSYGKTTLKYFLKQLLTDLNPLVVDKNINTPLGICGFINNNLSLFDRYLIVELGVDRKNGMKRFKKFLTLDYAIITSIDKQHLRTFKTIENIKKEKLAIQNLLKPNGTLFYNYDHIQDFVKLEGINYVPISSTDYQINEDQTIRFSSCSIKLPFKSKGIIFDAYLAYIVSTNFINKERIKLIMKNLTLPKRRKKVYRKGDLMIIDDSYNINLTSLRDDITILSNYQRPYQILTSGLVEVDGEEKMLKEFFSSLCCADYIYFNRKLNKKENKIVQELNLKNKISYKKHYHNKGTLLILTYGTKTTLH